MSKREVIDLVFGALVVVMSLYLLFSIVAPTPPIPHKQMFIGIEFPSEGG